MLRLIIIKQFTRSALRQSEIDINCLFCCVLLSLTAILDDVGSLDAFHLNQRGYEMGSKVHVKVEFAGGFSGTGITDSGYKVKIGPDGAVPYDLLLLSLVSCLHATFLDILNKKKIDFTSADIEVWGEKREQVPTTLKICELKIGIKGVDLSHRSSVEKSFELATKYCSVYKTVSSVAEIVWEVNFD